MNNVYNNINGMNTAPIFDKIEVTSRHIDVNTENELIYTYEKCGMFISGNHLMIVEKVNRDMGDVEISDTKIHNLNEIISYKTYNYKGNNN